MGLSAVYLLIFSGLVFCLLSLILSSLLVKSSDNSQKYLPYECGMPAETPILQQQHIGYYFYALIFLLFEVELIFLYPWAVVAKELGLSALIEIFAFIFILFLGFIYAHKKKVLKWI